MQTWTRKNMYFYILSSDVKSPWNYNLAFFDILLTTLSNACVLNIRSYVFFDLSFDCLSIFFFPSPCVESSSFDKPCFIRWQVLVFHLLFLFLIAFAFRQSHATLFVVRKKMHFNFYRNRSPVYPGLVFVIWHPRWMVLLLRNCKKAGPLFGYD